MDGVGHISGGGRSGGAQSSMFREAENPDLVLRLEPVSDMRTIFVSVEPDGVYLSWWRWSARTLADMGITKQDMMGYAECCRSTVVRREHSPFSVD